MLQVYSTGYGHGGRLGLGGTETVTTVKMIESLQHVAIKKVAVHSGGKHAMALAADGDVYSWGEGDDGKLGHGSRKYVRNDGFNTCKFLYLSNVCKPTCQVCYTFFK